jgi:hypothetical protein
MRIALALIIIPLVGGPSASTPGGVRYTDLPVAAASAAIGTPERCTEACYYQIVDNQVVGYGCIRGDEGSSCWATAYACNIKDDCILGMLTDESGTMLAIEKRCQLFSPAAAAVLVGGQAIRGGTEPIS